MRREVRAYTDAKKKLLNLFRCEADMPVKMMVGALWNIEENDGVYFLRYEPEPGGESLLSVIVGKNGEPWITEMNELTMIIAIDCIKWAFILKNSLRTSD